MTDTDLRKHPPRSPREKLGGLYFLARTVDKARAKLAGTPGPYKITPGMSGRLFEGLGISEADFLAVVERGASDDEVVAWVRAHSDPAAYDEINRKYDEAGLFDDAKRGEFAARYPFLRERTDLRNWFDVLEYDDRWMYEQAARNGGMSARFVSFKGSDGVVRPGVLGEDDTIRPFADGIANLAGFIALDEAGRRKALAALGAPVALDRVRLDAPVRPNKNVFCVGRNYMGHAEEGAKARGEKLELPDVPTFFTKAPSAIVGPGDTIALDGKLSPMYDWEVELAVVIGKRCRDVREDDALGVVFGYTVVNDVTARDLQRKHGQWFKGKTLDSTCPIGPWIVPAFAVDDPQALMVELKVNGERKQFASTSTMIFAVKRIIAELSAGLTLEPGDVIATGTPEGVGFARTPPEFLGDGDVVEAIVEKIGVLRNPVRISKVG
jgi:2-keto-4-pentenoate hydratase/2-oxohepta-3-ene-1,7-dioic acid hydratase in catechol pathway